MNIKQNCPDWFERRKWDPRFGRQLEHLVQIDHGKREQLEQLALALTFRVAKQARQPLFPNQKIILFAGQTEKLIFFVALPVQRSSNAVRPFCKPGSRLPFNVVLCGKEHTQRTLRSMA